MTDLSERVRNVVQRLGATKVAEICGISELMLLRVGVGILGKPGVLVRIAEGLPRLEGEQWAKEVTSTRKVVQTDLSPLDLTEREVLVRNAILLDFTLAVIVRKPGETARDLCKLAPGVNVVGEVEKAGAWLRANPERRKSNGARFLTNWVRSAQEKGGPSLVRSGGVYGRQGPVQPAVAPQARRWGMAAPASGVLPSASVTKVG